MLSAKKSLKHSLKTKPLTKIRLRKSVLIWSRIMTDIENYILRKKVVSESQFTEAKAKALGVPYVTLTQRHFA